MRKQTSRTAYLLATGLLALVAVGALFAIVQARAFAPTATRLVSAAGQDSGDCAAVPCASIGYAIDQADPGDTISVAAGVYTETNIFVDKDLTISGTGAISTVVQAAAAEGSGINARVFWITNSVSVTLSGMTIRHGHLTGWGYTDVDYGGGVRNDGQLTLVDVSVGYNRTASRGGGILNTSMLTLKGASVDHNQAKSHGGGIVNLGVNASLAMHNTTVSHNYLTQDDYVRGNGIYNEFGAITGTESTIADNTVSCKDDYEYGCYGGGLFTAGGQVRLHGSTIRGNSAVDGGGINNWGKIYPGVVTLSHCIIVSNTAAAPDVQGGGGIANHAVDANATITIEDSLIAGNYGYHGGAINNEGKPSVQAAMTLNRCTVSDNTAHDGGGIITGGSFQSCHVYLDLINSTVSGNQATTWGGGIQAWTWDCKDITVNLYHSTVATNTAHRGGGLDGDGDVTFTLQNSIVAGNTISDVFPSSFRDCSGGIRQSQGYNLISAAYGCPNNGTTDITPRTPLTEDLDLVLADNGGFAPTHALPAGSQAIDAIPAGANGCGTTHTVDQRGEPRPQNGRCDIGAYETAGVVLDVHVYLPIVMRAFVAPPGR